MVIARILAVAVFVIIGACFWLAVKALDRIDRQAQKLFKGFDALDKKPVDREEQICTIRAAAGITPGNKTTQETKK